MILQVGKNKNRSSHGFTLIELLVVIAIVAVMMGLSINFLGGTDSHLLKNQASRMAHGIRYAFYQSVTQVIPYRIVFDLSEQQYWLEQGTSTFLIKSDSAEEEEKQTQKSSNGADAEPSPPEFTPVDQGAFKKIILDERIKIKDVYIAHQEEAITVGRAYLYFFPHGQSEVAVIHLSDEEEEIFFSIIVNPLTGASRVEGEFIRYEDIIEK